MLKLFTYVAVDKDESASHGQGSLCRRNQLDNFKNKNKIISLFLRQGDFLLYFTVILQRIKIIKVDAGFEPRTSAPEVWCAPMSHHIYVTLCTIPYFLRQNKKLGK